MTTISIGSHLGVEGAGELRERLLPHVRGKREVILATERIDRLHSAALQVLCAFVRDRARAGRATRIDAPAELGAAAELLGVAELLGLAQGGPR